MIKQGNSDTYPEMIVVSNDFYQIRYNIHEVTKEDELKGKHTSYNYDYIELTEVSDMNINLELEKNGVEKEEDRKKIRDEILGKIGKTPLKGIVKLRDQLGRII